MPIYESSLFIKIIIQNSNIFAAQIHQNDILFNFSSKLSFKFMLSMFQLLRSLFVSKRSKFLIKNIIIKSTIMFFAKIITQDKPFVYSDDTVDQTVGDVISISNVALAPTSKQDASLYIKIHNKEHLIAALSKNNPQVALNFYISIEEQAELFVKGNGIVHAIGFFEPEPHIQPLDEVELHRKDLEQQQKAQDQEILTEIVHRKKQEIKRVQNTNQVHQKTEITKTQQVVQIAQSKSKSHQQKQKQEESQQEKSIENKQKPVLEQRQSKKVQNAQLQKIPKQVNEQDQDGSQDDEDYEDQPIIEEEQSNGSPLVGLQDIDDDINVGNEPRKVLPQKNIKQDYQQNKQNLNKQPNQYINQQITSKKKNKNKHKHNQSNGD